MKCRPLSPITKSLSLPYQALSMTSHVCSVPFSSFLVMRIKSDNTTPHHQEIPPATTSTSTLLLPFALPKNVMDAAAAAAPLAAAITTTSSSIATGRRTPPMVRPVSPSTDRAFGGCDLRAPSAPRNRQGAGALCRSLQTSWPRCPCGR